MTKIEILVVRDPDAATNLTVFIDGVEFNGYTEVDIDPGAGCELQDWLTAQVEIALSDHSDAFKALALEEYAAFDGSPYIEGDDRVVRCEHGEGDYPNRTYCQWEHPFEDVESAAVALKEHRRTTHPEK